MTAAQSLADATTQVYDAIRADILSGRCAPLEHLREVPLSERMGVSRTPVRLALKQLARDGFVVLRPNRGAYVAPWDRKTLSEIAEVRAHLAVMAGRLAAASVTPADLARLRHAAAAVSEGIDDPAGRDIDRCAHAILAFHEEVFRIGRNDLLAQLYRQTTYVPVVHRTFHRFTEADWMRIRAYPDQVIDALAEGDGICAGAVMQSYFLAAKRAIVAAGDPEGTQDGPGTAPGPAWPTADMPQTRTGS